jgi:hypothetical protein
MLCSSNSDEDTTGKNSVPNMMTFSTNASYGTFSLIITAQLGSKNFVNSKY